jgi:RNA polymerase sigma factor for flagellar operon FliA
VDDADLLEKARPLVARLAAKVTRRLPYRLGLDWEELTQVGMIAAWEAAPRWDARRGAFATFVGRRVYGAMLDAVRAAGVVGFTCVNIRRRAAAGEQVWVRSLSESTSGSHGRDEGDRLTNYGGRLAVGDNLAGADGRDAEYDPPADRVRDAVRGAGGWLGPGEAGVLADYFFGGMTLKEIGRARGLCESRVSQMVSGILKRIRTEAGECDGQATERGRGGRDAARVVGDVLPEPEPPEDGPEVLGR